MKFNFTIDDLKKCVPNNKNTQELFDSLNRVLPRYEIDTVERVAAFLAQCGHESLDFTVLKENLNYSAKGLRLTFPKYFKDDASALNYQRKPEKIANRIYANRMGNSNEASGDGWKFRGRGAIQLTGKENYVRLSLNIDRTLDETISYLETLEGAIESACFFWESNKLNQFADKKDNLTLTKRINGGTHGLDDRNKRFQNNLKVLS